MSICISKVPQVFSDGKSDLNNRIEYVRNVYELNQDVETEKPNEMVFLKNILILWLKLGNEAFKSAIIIQHLIFNKEKSLHSLYR